MSPSPGAGLLPAARRALSRALLRLAGHRGDAIWVPRPLPSDHLLLGRHSYGHPTVHVYPGDKGLVRVGSFVSIADDVEIFVGGEHRTDWVSTYPFRSLLELPGAFEDGHPATKGDVEIGHDVWIGRGARILSGVHVGNGAVVGAYAVVAKDVRPYAVVSGNPATEVRRRFSDDQVQALESMAWWNWPIERIIQQVPRLCSPDLEGFLRDNPPGPVAGPHGQEL